MPTFTPDSQEKHTFTADRIAPNPYSGLNPDSAIKKSNTLWNVATENEVPFEDVENRSITAEEINVHQILTQSAPDIATPDDPRNQFGLTSGLSTGQKARRRTEEETIRYNMGKLPNTPRAKHMANQYLRQRRARKKIESEKVAELKDVLTLDFYLAYLVGGAESAEAVGGANIFKNKPKAFAPQQYPYLVDSPNSSFTPSIFDTMLDSDRAEEVQMLVDMGDANARREYYKSKGVITYSEFHEKKDNREYMLFSDTLKALKSNEIRNAIERLQDPQLNYATSEFTAHGLSPNYDRDALLIRNHFFQLEEVQARGVSVGATLSDMGLDMAKYMGEIALLSGVTSGATQGGTKSFQLARGKSDLIKRAATVNLRKLGVPKLIASNTGTLTSAMAMTTANPSQIANLTIGRITDKGYLGDSGQFIKTDEGQVLLEALPRSFAESTLTYFIERKGDDVVRGLFSVGKGALNKLPKELVSKFDDVAQYMRQKGIRSFDKLPNWAQATIKQVKGHMGALAEKGQFNGVFGENIEEYLEKITKPILGLDDQYRNEDESYIDRVARGIMMDKEDWTQTMYQSILFTAIPFATGAIGTTQTGIEWAGKALKPQPSLPEVKSRIDLENSIMNEYGADRKQAADIATMLDNGATANKIEKHIQSFGGEFANFSFDDHNNRKALAMMLVDRGLVSTEAIALAEIVTKKAKEQGATVQEIVNTDEFKHDADIAERTDPFEGIAEAANKAGDTREPVNTEQQTIDDAVDEATQRPKAERVDKEEETAPAAEVEVEGEKVKQPDFEAGEETKQRGLGVSVEEEAERKNVVEAFENIPDYNVVPMDKQYDLAAQIIVNDYERAKRIAMGIEADVQWAKDMGIIPEMIYVAVTNKAVRDGDAQLLEDLATQSGLLAEATTMGQRIRALGELGEHSPIRAITKIQDTRKDALAKDKKGTIKNLKKNLAKAEKELEKAQKKLANKELDNITEEISRGTEKPKSTPRSKGYGSKNKIVTKERADAAMKRIGDTSKLFAGIDPKKFLDVLEVSTYHMEAIGRNFAEWSKVLVSQLGEGVKPHLKELWKKSSDALARADMDSALAKINKGAGEGKDVSSFAVQIRKLAKALIIQGFDTRVKLVNAVHKELQEIFPDITKRETSDAISGFGKFQRLTTVDVDVILRDIKGQLQQLSKLEDMAAGIAPAKTGIERRTPSTEERALIKQVEEAKKKGGFEVTDPAKQLKTALDAIKTRLKNQIADLEKQIKEKKKTVKKKTPSPTDAETEALRVKRDALKGVFDEMFGKKGLTAQQRISNAKARLRSDITKLNERIAKGDFKPKEKVSITDDIELKTLRHGKEKAQRVVDTAREIIEKEGGISKEEVRNIMGLSQRIEDAKIAMEAGERRTPNSNPTDVEMEYGMAVVAFEKYVEAIQHKAAKKAIPQKLKTWFNIFNLELLSDIAGTAKSIRAAMDNSFIGRQGIKVFYLGATGNFGAGKVWMDTFMKSIKTIIGSLSGKPVMDTLRAEILSDPQYDLMRRAKVATAVAEEEFPVHWPSKIPAIGRLFKASEEAFTASAYYMRYRTAKMYFDIAKKSGVDLNDKNELESIGILVNSLTARGDTGNYGAKDDLINRVFWSPKMIKSNIDVYTAHRFNQNMSKFAHKQAARNLIRIIMGQAAVLFIANMVWPDSVETDPTSSDFGKIKIGNTRFDISGGSMSMFVLALRLAKGEFKASSGRTVELDSGGYGGMDSMDLVWNFMENKFSPAANAAKQTLMVMHGGQDWRTGKEMTWATVAEGLVVPLPVESAIELMQDPDSAPVLAAMLAEIHGISAQNYKSKFKGFE